jgi:hypothetical protein
MGDLKGVRSTLDKGRRLLDGVSWAVRTDNHFAIDPNKWEFYAMDAYRLAGDDERASEYARDVLQKGIAPDGTERSPMRVSEARLTLAVAASRKGELEESIRLGLQALQGHRRSLPTLLMTAGELDAELQKRWPDEAAVEEFREAVRTLH